MFGFSNLALVFGVPYRLSSGGGKPRIPSGIEGWAGFLPPATTAVRYFCLSLPMFGGVRPPTSLLLRLYGPDRNFSDAHSRQRKFRVNLDGINFYRVGAWSNW
jgi:hypothetical protein